MPSPRRALGADDVAAMAGRCFRPPDPEPGPEKIGLEFEWLTISARNPDDRLDLRALQVAAAAGGDLPGGGTVTFEPGGQLELNTGPTVGLDAACDAAHTDARELSRRMERVGVALVPIGLDAFRPPRRVLTTGRYDAMEAAFDAKGPHGRRMMCNTAALQVNVDLGPGDPCGRWRLAHAIGPTMIACFANSPFGEDAGTGRPSGWGANRLATWWGIDPSRTAAPALTDDPADTWLRYALAANVLLIRTDPEGEGEGQGEGVTVPVLRPFSFAEWMTDGHPAGWPTADDFAYHLTTLFPPVRPRQWLELRMLDAVDATIWPVAVAVIVTLLTDPDVVPFAVAATADTAGLWPEAARDGLAHPDLARSAEACFAAAVAALARTGASTGLCDAVGEYADRYVARRRCPADDRLDEWHAVGRLLPEGNPIDKAAAWAS